MKHQIDTRLLFWKDEEIFSVFASAQAHILYLPGGGTTPEGTGGSAKIAPETEVESASAEAVIKVELTSPDVKSFYQDQVVPMSHEIS